MSPNLKTILLAACFATLLGCATPRNKPAADFTFTVDSARYGFSEIINGDCPYGMELALYHTNDGLQGVVRHSEGSWYLGPTVVPVKIDENRTITFTEPKGYGFRGKITQQSIKGEILYVDGKHYQDVILARYIGDEEEIWTIADERQRIPIDGEYSDLSYWNGRVHGTRLRIMRTSYFPGDEYVAYIQQADKTFGKIVLIRPFKAEKNHIAFEPDPKDKLPFKKFKGDVYCKFMEATMTMNDNTTSSLTLIRR